ncbi:MAG: hypothetical protein IJ678_05915, partial [Kiritimatiellae bacterium]|nr:hypothetical protein [Kiritimatiellia bacterium]
PPVADPDVSRVAAAGIALLSAGRDGAALAHARWIAARTFSVDGAANGGPAPHDAAFDPESALLVVLFAAQLPPETTPFPVDWRNRVADRLLAAQEWDAESGAFFWKDGGGDPVRGTRLAVLAARLLLAAR